MRFFIRGALAALVLLSASPAHAGIAYPTNVAGTFADAAVNLQCDASGANCQPVTAANPVPTGGTVAAGAADSGNPVKIGGRYSVTAPTLTDGQRGDLLIGVRSQAIMSPFSASSPMVDAVSNSPAITRSMDGATTLYTPGLGHLFNGTSWDRQRGDANGVVVQSGLSATFWSYAAASGGIVSSTADVAIKAAAGAGVRNFLKSITISHDTLSAASEFVIKDGATIVYRGKLQTAAVEGGSELIFDPPLRGTANTALNVALITSVTGGVYVNATGFTGN